MDQVRLLLHPTPEQRLDAHQLVKINFFDDVGVKTLNYLDSLFQWDNLQKSQVIIIISLSVFFLIHSYLFYFTVFQGIAANSSTTSGTSVLTSSDALSGQRVYQSVYGPLYPALRSAHCTGDD